MPDQPAPDFEEARALVGLLLIDPASAGVFYATAEAQAKLESALDALLSEREAREARARRVEYAWENLRGWMPNGRGVKNWTREMNDAVAALPATESAQADPNRDPIGAAESRYADEAEGADPGGR